MVENLLLEELEEVKKKVQKGDFPGKPETRKAKKFLIEQLLARGFSQTEIARQFDWSRKTVAKPIFACGGIKR